MGIFPRETGAKNRAPVLRSFESATLARRAAEDPNFPYHYVTAREMFNLVRAAEEGWKGSVAEARDFELVWNGCGQGQPGRETANSGRETKSHAQFITESKVESHV